LPIAPLTSGPGQILDFNGTGVSNPPDGSLTATQTFYVVWNGQQTGLTSVFNDISNFPVSSPSWLAAGNALATNIDLADPPDDAANAFAGPTTNLLAAVNQYQAGVSRFLQVADMLGTFSLLLGIDIGEAEQGGMGQGLESIRTPYAVETQANSAEG
jgi:hypothetical protein